MKKIVIVLCLLSCTSLIIHAQINKMNVKNQPSKNTISNVQLQNNGSTNLKIIKLQLPGDPSYRDYYVKEDGEYYVLNGDILIPKNPSPNNISVKKGYFQDNPNCKTCSVTRDDSHAWYSSNNYKWENGMIPVEIAPSVYSSGSCSIVKDALEYMNATTGLVFYPRKAEKDYISIIVLKGDQGGSSPVGKQGGIQLVNLFTGNFTMYTVCHELMHAAGVFHEQCRKDRDNFISINMDNIIDDQKHNFQIEDNGTSHGAFDFCSIMQYSSYINSMAIDISKPVITCKPSGCPACMGKRTGLTDLDKKGLDLFYGQIGVSRVPSNQKFEMGCTGTYLDQKIAAEKMITLNGNNPDVVKFTGGITLYGTDNTKLAIHVPGNTNDGDGYFIKAYRNDAYYFYSNKTGIASGQGSIIGKLYNTLGNKLLGWPETSEAKYLNGSYQIFNHGYIYSTPMGEAFYITKGPIYTKWADGGGIAKGLGWPKKSETLLPDGKGYFQIFEHGLIYWNAAYGAFVIKGKIYDAWAAQKWEQGQLGYPVSDFVDQTPKQQPNQNPGNTGVTQFRQEQSGYQAFEHGVIFWTFTPGINEATEVQLGNPKEILAKSKKSMGTRQSSGAMTPMDSSKINNIKNLPPKQKSSTAPRQFNNGAINPQPLPPKTIKQN